MATSPAVAAKPAAAPASVPQAPADPLTGYYRAVRQMNLQLAKDRYKQGFKVRTQEYIRGRGTLAIVDEEICMGCTHCFDNCAFEAIGMVDRKFALPEYSYTSRKAVIIDDNCVGCEKCAVVEITRPSFTSKPYFVTIVIASPGQTIAHFSHPTQLSSMITAFRDVYEYSGRANLRSTMPIASKAQLSKQWVQPMQIPSSTIAKVPRPRMYSCVRTLKPCLYRSFASCKFIWRTRP